MADENLENTEKQTQEINPIFEVDALVKDSYNLIAQWHNDDASSAGLKQLSLELVEKIAGAALQHIGLNAQLTIDKTNLE